MALIIPRITPNQVQNDTDLSSVVSKYSKIKFEILKKILKLYFLHNIMVEITQLALAFL